MLRGNPVYNNHPKYDLWLKIMLGRVVALEIIVGLAVLKRGWLFRLS
jgi:hypothetical protein